jgi:glycosyltransferase involved in cell wall biosynthesis
MPSDSDNFVANRSMKIAIVHEWFDTYAGSERVVEQLLQVFPDAHVFGVVDFLSETDRKFLEDRPVRTTFIQRLPMARQKFRSYLPLMPLAIEQIDLRGYDLVLSSSHAVAKGVLTGPDQLHVSYVHSPMRYAWDLQHQYLQESGLTRGLKSAMARMVLHYMRLWDYRTAAGVDVFLANSSFIARRIKKVYGRDARVVYPPVDVEAFARVDQKENFYLAAARMVPYKKMPMIVEAFSRMPDKRLVVIGEGPDLQRCKSLAQTPNIELIGYQPFAQLRDYMQRARAYVFAAEEDFGITMVEAQACGTPVIAYGRGGACETVQPLGTKAQPTGVLFDAQTPEAICEAVGLFEVKGQSITPEHCRRNAERFAINSFRTNYRGEVERALQERRGTLAFLPQNSPAA